jgi:hypothetical protein
MAGYSGSSLVKKLGIKEGFSVGLVDAPPDFANELDGLPEGVRFIQRVKTPVDLIVLFVKSETVLRRSFQKLAKKITPAGMLWVAWPKKSAGVPTDLNFAIVQRIGLDAGLVDTKICAVNDIWSGLRFVYRLKDRKWISNQLSRPANLPKSG